MGRVVLLMRLEGPLQSWGSRAKWDVRDTQAEPTKSGVIGLLGCALGYGKDDRRLVERLDAGLRFGVRVENPGSVSDDFQTISGFLPTAEGSYKHSGIKTATSLTKLMNDPDVTPATVISPRSYLEDAAFLVALEETGEAPGVLEECADALVHPVWPMYLGRKACIPSRPVFEKLTDEYDGIEDALKQHPWSWKRDSYLERKGAPTRAYVEDVRGNLIRQDALRINAARQYGFRHARELTKEDLGDVPIKTEDQR